MRSSSIQHPYKRFDPLRQRLRGEYKLRQRQTSIWILMNQASPLLADEAFIF
jgi:hypothetical protein